MIRRRWRWLAGLLIGPPLIAWLGFFAAVRWWPYPSDIGGTPPLATVIHDRDGRPLAEFAAADGAWRLPSADLGRWLPLAVVAVEDHRFHAHGGVDWLAATAALTQNLRAGRTVRGASTLSMQLQRLRDPRPRTLASKLREAVRACQLERDLGKSGILAEWCARAPFGGNLVGVEAASRRWFGRPCAALTLAEAALLAGLPQSPERLRPDRHPDAARARRAHVLARMRATGVIDVDAERAAAATPLPVALVALAQRRKAAPPADGALPALAGLAGLGGTVPTTLSAATQARAAGLLATHLGGLAAAGVDAAAAVVLDTASGETLALVSLAPGAPALDCCRVRRSSGSLLKPFIYADAFAAGICGPRTTLRDAPLAWAGWAPANSDRGWRGELSAGEALAESRNLPALILAGRLGVARVGRLFAALGIADGEAQARRAGLGLAIGGVEATPLDIAGAYAALARGGDYGPVRLRRGMVEVRTSVIARDACLQTLAALALRERTAAIDRAAAALGVAWKTGTSSRRRDAWCAAVTPRRTVVVWLGRCDGAGAQVLVGVESAAPVALAITVACDPGGPGFAAPAAGTAPHVQALTAMVQPLTLIAPADGAGYVLDPDLPVTSQRLALREAGGAPGRRWWFVDGTLIAETTAETEVPWLLAAGTHELRVVDAAGSAAVARITVRPAE